MAREGPGRGNVTVGPTMLVLAAFHSIVGPTLVLACLWLLVSGDRGSKQPMRKTAAILVAAAAGSVTGLMRSAQDHQYHPFPA